MDKGSVLKAKSPATQKDILGVCCDPLVLAQQLTHLELVSATACTAWGRMYHRCSLIGASSLVGQTGESGEAHVPDQTCASGSPGSQQPFVHGRGWGDGTAVATG